MSDSRRFGSRADRDRHGRHRRRQRNFARRFYGDEDDHGHDQEKENQPQAEQSAGTADSGVTDVDVATEHPPTEHLPTEHTPTGYTPPQREHGLAAVIMRWFKRGPKPSLAERGDPPPSEDPVRRILAVPRGPARLDTFEETLHELTPGTHGHRGVVLAFHRELVAMADHANVDLSLLQRRVLACADALIDAGESERAGELLARVGKKHRAAELFVSAGAIEKLEAAHFDIETEEGGARLSARLAFEQFEARFLVGLRAQALVALREAVRLWPDHAIYRDILDGIEARRPAPGVIDLSHQERQYRFTRQWPLLIGRGENVSLRLRSPLLSRAHAEIALQGKMPYVRAISDHGDLRYQGQEGAGPFLLSGDATLDIGGVPLHCVLDDIGLHLEPAHESGRRCTGLLVSTWTLAGVMFGFSDDGRVHVAQQANVNLNGDRLIHDTTLLRGDRITAKDGSLIVIDGPHAA